MQFDCPYEKRRPRHLAAAIVRSAGSLKQKIAVDICEDVNLHAWIASCPLDPLACLAAVSVDGLANAGK